MSIIAKTLRAGWRWGRVIWVCRVSVLSAGAGGLLLAGTPQARDFFADLGLFWWQWLAFFVLALVWAGVVHKTARRALQYDDWVADAHCQGGLSPERREQLRDVYYWPALIVPRLLGLSVLLFVAGAIWRARSNLVPVAGGLAEAAEAVTLENWLLAASLVVTVAFVLAVWRRRLIEHLLAKTIFQWPVPEPPLLAGLLPFPLPLLRWRQGVRKPEPRRTTAIRLGGFLVSAGILASFFVALVAPLAMAEWLPRVLLAPLLFGGIVFMLGWIAAWSHRLATPFLLLLVLLAFGCLYLASRFHDVRWIDHAASASPAMGASRQITLPEAVARWKTVNACDPGAGPPCPRPILIAGAGGASRAAFLTATVIGSLIDLGQTPRGRQAYGNVRNRIFALSTVSGSSLAAVVIRAALSDALEDGHPDRPPCRQAVGSRPWFRSIGNAGEQNVGAADPTVSWRDCFQLLLAGDFLSPVLVGLVYRDNFPLGNPVTGRALWTDRAALLERGFERRYHAVTTDGSPRSCRAAPGRGLCRPFGWHPDPRTAGAWLPLLFINGTSVQTGRRIITADIPMGSDAIPGQPLLPFAYDVNELRVPPTSMKTSDGTEHGEDLRLSTAATMSARFPVISPQGNLRALTGNRIDSVVDGGYFENDGLATIADVAAALRADFHLDPVVIRIVNEPSQAANEDHSLGKDRPPMPDEAERTPFDDIGSIFRALTATRSGHEDGHEAYLKSVLTNPDRLYDVGVYPLALEDPQMPSPKQMLVPQANPLCRRTVTTKAAMEFVSMSWWMSHPVQAYLDAQLCVRANWERLACELREGRAGAAGATCEPLHG